MPKKKENLLSTKEFGDKVGVNDARIRAAIKSGILTQSVKKVGDKGGRYKIDEEKGIQEWKDNIDPAKQRDPKKQNETRELNADSNGGGMSHYQKAKAHKEFFAAKLAELQYQEKAGKLVPVDMVRAECFRISRRVRDSMLAVSDRVASELVNMDDPREISIYIKEQIAIALKDLESMNHVGKPK